MQAAIIGDWAVGGAVTPHQAPTGGAAEDGSSA